MMIHAFMILSEAPKASRVVAMISIIHDATLQMIHDAPILTIHGTDSPVVLMNTELFLALIKCIYDASPDDP